MPSDTNTRVSSASDSALVMPPAARESPLVGRAAQLAELVEWLEINDPQGSGLVLLGGDAGVGKTRLLREVGGRALSQGRLTVVGHCLDFGDSALAYLPFSEILGRLQGEHPDALEQLAEEHPAIARLLPGQRVRPGGPTGPGGTTDPDPDDRLRGDLGDTRTSRSALFAGVLAVLEDVTRRDPLLVVVEDVHWADQSSRELLSYLFARGTAAPVSLVVSFRSDDVHRRHPLRPTLAEWSRLPALHRMQLGPLAESDVRALVHALHPAPLGHEEMRAIVARADGNAFFVEELVSAARSGGSAIPEDLADVLLVRLDRLDEATRTVVRAVSAAGRRVSHQLLATVLRESGFSTDDLDRALRQAVDALVLEPRRGGAADTYSFRHALLSEAVYDDLLPGERVRLHTAYVSALQTGEVSGTAAELAGHARAAHDTQTAIRASVEAGDEAMRVGAPEEAARHYEVALDLLGADAAEAVGLVVRAADALAAAGDPYRAAKLLAAQLAGLPQTATPESRARLLVAQADTAYLTEVDLDPLDLTTTALGLVPEDPPTPLRAEALAIHARALLSGGEREASIRFATEAIELATSLGLPGVARSAALTLARIEDVSGNPNAALARLDDVLDRARADDDVDLELKGLHQLGGLRYGNGEFAQARKVYLIAAARAREVKRPWAPYGLDGRGLASLSAYALGDWDEALRDVDTSGETPPPAAEAFLSAIRLAVEAGRRTPDALAHAAALRPFWDRDGMLALLSGGAAIDLHGDVGDVDGAVTVHDQLVETLERLWPEAQLWVRVRLAALLLGQLARHAAARPRAERGPLAACGDRYADAARTFWQSRSLEGPSRVEARAWRRRVEAEQLRLHWLADVDPPPAAELVTAWRECVAAFEELGHVFEIARSRARLAAVLHAVGEPSEAREHVAAARSVARRLGAEPLLAELRTVGGPGRAAEERTGTSTTLTVREREILALVAQGRSNGEIGRQLFISTKTVSVHVSNILAKLGAAGRTEAAAIARRDGVLQD